MFRKQKEQSTHVCDLHALLQPHVTLMTVINEYSEMSAFHNSIH